jgi:hypothetical protein
MPPFPKLPLYALAVAALASAAEHHPSIAPGARAHPPIEEPAVSLPKFNGMTQAPAGIRGTGAIALPALQASAAEVGPDEEPGPGPKKHAHPEHDHREHRELGPRIGMLAGQVNVTIAAHGTLTPAASITL